MTLLMITTWGAATAQAARLHLPDDVDPAPWRSDLAVVEALTGSQVDPDVRMAAGEPDWLLTVSVDGAAPRSRHVALPRDLAPVRVALGDSVLALSLWRPQAGLELRW